MKAILRAVKNFFVRIGSWFKGLFETQEGFLSYKEQKQIFKSNRAAIRHFEAQKKRKNVPESEYITQMKDDTNIVEFENLCTYFYTDMGVVKSVDGVSFSIPERSTVGIVGESGCGKSVTSLSLMRLIQGPTGQITDGSIRFKASSDTVYDIAKMPMSKINEIRGKDISMIFQEPMTSLNPVFTVGYQLDEVVLLHEAGATKAHAREKSIAMLNSVGIAMAEKVYKQYPHELSGGMRQRVMIAMAIICNPRLVVADEPTTALDVTIQAQILDLFREVRERINGSIMLITHDLGVIAEMADYVVIMYAGRIIEKGTVQEIFKNPKHPYTVGLQKCKPTLNQTSDELYNIPGHVPSPINMPTGCYFKDRCEHCMDECRVAYPPEVSISRTHSVACFLCKNDSASDLPPEPSGTPSKAGAMGRIKTKRSAASSRAGTGKPKARAKKENIEEAGSDG